MSNVQAYVDARCDQIWLELAPGVSVAVEREKALTLTHAGFFDLYCGCVYRAKKEDARRFADEQIAARAVFLGTVSGQAEVLEIHVSALKRAILAPLLPFARWLAGR